MSVDPATSERTIIKNTGGFPAKASAANIISESYTVTSSSLIADVVQKCTPSGGTSTIHLKYTQGIGDTEMIGRINELLSQCSFADFDVNTPTAGHGIWKMEGGCDRLVHATPGGCVSRERRSFDELSAVGEAGWSIAAGINGECVDYLANRLLIVRGNANSCIAKFNHTTGEWSNFEIVDCSDYFELAPPAPDLTIDPRYNFKWVANKGYRNPFQIFPPNTPCP